jgi:hypothetical protein
MSVEDLYCDVEKGQTFEQKRQSSCENPASKNFWSCSLSRNPCGNRASKKSVWSGVLSGVLRSVVEVRVVLPLKWSGALIFRNEVQIIVVTPRCDPKKVLKYPKTLFLFSVGDLSSLSINILQNINCYLNKMDIEQTRPNI